MLLIASIRYKYLGSAVWILFKRLASFSMANDVFFPSVSLVGKPISGLAFISKGS